MQHLYVYRRLYMNKKEIELLKEIISNCAGSDLKTVKDIVDDEIDKNYHKKENFMYHDKIDDYLYRVHMKDGSSRLFCFGSDAYGEYTRNEMAISITRMTKNLFPTTETLLIK